MKLYERCETCSGSGEVLARQEVGDQVTLTKITCPRCDGKYHTLTAEGKTLAALLGVDFNDDWYRVVGKLNGVNVIQMKGDLAKKKFKRIYVTCPVRNAVTVEQEARMDAYVDELRKAGHTVHYPRKDTDQTLSGPEICKIHCDFLRTADENHVFWDETSKGSHFDIGMGWAFNVPAILVESFTGRPGHRNFVDLMEELGEPCDPFPETNFVDLMEELGEPCDPFPETSK